jgi:hypothetical protein
VLNWSSTHLRSLHLHPPLPKRPHSSLPAKSINHKPLTYSLLPTRQNPQISQPKPRQQPHRQNVSQANRLQAPHRLAILPRRQRRRQVRRYLPSPKGRNRPPQIHRCRPRCYLCCCCGEETGKFLSTTSHVRRQENRAQANHPSPSLPPANTQA